jgi:hypothetical protein
MFIGGVFTGADNVHNILQREQLTFYIPFILDSEHLAVNSSNEGHKFLEKVLW